MGEGGVFVFTFVRTGFPNSAPPTWDTPATTRMWIPWRTLDTAGLTPQLRARGSLQQNTSGAAHLRPAHLGVDLDGIPISPIGVTAVDLSSASPTERFKDSHWAALTAGYTVYDFISPALQIQGNGVNDAALTVVVGIRWVG